MRNTADVTGGEAHRSLIAVYFRWGWFGRLITFRYNYTLTSPDGVPQLYERERVERLPVLGVYDVVAHAPALARPVLAQQHAGARPAIHLRLSHTSHA
jgi:hypothetical protein